MCNRLALSIVQDIITAISLGTIKSEKHVLLPRVIKTLTGNVQLIKIINRFGHGYSYTVLEEFDTALCINKVANIDSDSVSLPSKVNPAVPTVLAFDNIDRFEESLSGGGTLKRVNGVIVQPKSLSCLPPQQTSSVTKIDKQKSIRLSYKLLPIYKFQRCTSSVESVPSIPLRRSSRYEPPSQHQRVYERKCIFCVKVSKYCKGTRTWKEPHVYDKVVLMMGKLPYYLQFHVQHWKSVWRGRTS